MQQNIFGCVEGAQSYYLAKYSVIGKPIIYLSRNDVELKQVARGLLLFEPNAEVYSLPAWDCVPYDRLSPHGDITGERISTLSKLASRDLSDKKVIILLTINSFLQKIPPKSFFSNASLFLKKRHEYNLGQITSFLEDSGFNRTNTVREYGEYAIRVDIVDIFSNPSFYPHRLDFFWGRD